MRRPKFVSTRYVIHQLVHELDFHELLYSLSGYSPPPPQPSPSPPHWEVQLCNFCDGNPIFTQKAQILGKPSSENDPESFTLFPFLFLFSLPDSHALGSMTS